jgi:hypothetical protein
MGGTGTGGMGTMPGPMLAPPWALEGSGHYINLASTPIGMSRDGNRVLFSNGLLLTAAGTNPASLIQTIGSPTALSADGSTVIGETKTAPVCDTPARWTMSGTETLGLAEPSAVSFVSADGRAVAGNVWPSGVCQNGQTLPYFSFGGLQLSVPMILGSPSSTSIALSGDGMTLFGFAWTGQASPQTGTLFSFSMAKGLTVFPGPQAALAFGTFTTPDGSALAGTISDAGGNFTSFQWTSASGMRTLPKIASRLESITLGLSADGSVVLALGTNAPSSPPVAAAQDGVPFVWTAAGGTEMLPPHGPMVFDSAVMTPDASLVFGNPTPNVGSWAMRWSRTQGGTWGGLPVFADAPMFTGFCHPVVTFASDDGKTLAGACDAGGRKTGFVARF